MLDAVRPLAVQFELNERLFADAIGDMEESVWLRRFGEGANHAAFLALHLLDARTYVVRLLGGDVSHGFEEVGKDASTLEDVSDYPEPSAILTSWHRVSSALERALQDVSLDRLAAPPAHRFPVSEATTLGAIAFLAQHEGYHLGQLGIIRRAAGLQPLSFS